jgi:hypothetical protein
MACRGSWRFDGGGRGRLWILSPLLRFVDAAKQKIDRQSKSEMAERQQEMSPEPLVDDTVSPMTNTPPTPKHTSRLEVGGEDEEEGEDVVCLLYNIHSRYPINPPY